ncbi:MAG: hypothetical protein ROO76_04335 [Terriglobia bacterium]|nr:hypothetical protein [Terriglobia bacterium]
MSQTVLERTADQIAESAHQACCATRKVGDALQDAVGVLGSTAKRGGDAAEEFVNDTAQRIQRHPALTVAATFAVGLTTGALIGLLIKRK